MLCKVCLHAVPSSTVGVGQGASNLTLWAECGPSGLWLAAQQFLEQGRDGMPTLPQPCDQQVGRRRTEAADADAGQLRRDPMNDGGQWPPFLEKPSLGTLAGAAPSCFLRRQDALPLCKFIAEGWPVPQHAYGMGRALRAKASDCSPLQNLQKEPQALCRRVGPRRIGIAALGLAARPGMSGAFDPPDLDRVAGRVPP